MKRRHWLILLAVIAVMFGAVGPLVTNTFGLTGLAVWSLLSAAVGSVIGVHAARVER